MKALRPFFFIIAITLITGLACAFGGSTSATQEPTAQEKGLTVTPKPSKKSPQTGPTETPDGTDELPGVEPQAYYTETFDGSLDNYTYFNLGKGDETKMSLSPDNGSLVFDLKDNNLWVYVTYNPYIYKDVVIEVTASNQAKKDNTIGLICRYSQKQSWYEFNISQDGSYWIYAYDMHYNKIAEGISTAVNGGQNSNTYRASCIGDQLSLKINNTEVKTIRETKFKFGEGKVGFGVSSFNRTPVTVNVDSFTISEP